MRLLAITPIRVSDDELARRQRRYDRLAPAGVLVRLENLGDGPSVPHALNDADDIVASERALLERFAAVETTDVDGFLPDCVLDPVVEHSERFAVPVYGIGRLTAHFLAGLGATFGSVARNHAIATELDHKLASYGPSPRPRTAALDLSVEDIADDAVWADAVARTVRGLDSEYVINACSAVDLQVGPTGPTIVDPTHTALRLLALGGSVSGVVG